MSTFALNCLLLNDTPTKVFTVKVPESENVSILKEMIKEKKARHLGHLDASDLILWKLDTPIPLSHRTGPDIAQDVRAVQIHLPNEADEGNDLVQLLDAAEDVSDYWTRKDGPQPKHLHILVQKPAVADIQTVDPTQLLSVNCLSFKDDPTKAFTVKIPKTDNVSVLKKKIKEEKARHLAHLDASDLILYKISLPTVDVDSNTDSKATPVVTRIPLQPLEELKDVFPEPLQKSHVHIIFEHELNESTPASLTKSCILQPRQVAIARQQFCQLRSATSPSAGAKPKDFRKGQEKAPIHCNRPHDTAKTLPLRLCHPVFGHFMDECESFKPTPEDKTFLNEFVVAMSSFYDTEKDRQTKILELFRTAGIVLQPNKIIGTEYTTDGSSFFAGHLLYVLAELKNEIGSTNSEPYLQAVLYYLEATRSHVSKYLTSGFPCIILLIYGPHIAFAGAIWTGKPNVQVLTTSIPCHYHSSNIEMRDMLLRHLGAFRNASKSLERYYQELKPSGSSDLLSRRNPTFPYPTSFTSNSTRYTFRYLSELESEHNFVFFGDLDTTFDRQKLCIKFTHQYGEDVHRFCAAKGHAPKLYMVQRLPGGFYMVVMDDIREEYIDLHNFVNDGREIRSSAAYAELKNNIRTFLEEMHQGGWVHGDLRSTNVMVKKSGLDGSFLFIDFDWSGKNQEVVYPSFLNTTEVDRPEGADDGEPILALHDVEMLSYF